MAESDRRYTRINRMSRRDFLARAGGAAVAMPTMAAILAACSNPRASSGSSANQLVLARPNDPVTLPIHGQPIPTDTPIEQSTLQMFNWADYTWPKMLTVFQEKFGQKVEYTTFNNMSDAIARLNAGQVKPDVFFPVVEDLGKLVAADLLLPLNHDLIPSIKDDWPEFSGTSTPFYDQGWHYTVPYTIYTTGIGYRRDHVDDAEVAEKGYDIFWDPKYRGKVGIYDDYRTAIGMALLKNGITDLNTGNPQDIATAKNDLLGLIDAVNVRTSINGAYAKLPEDEFWIHQAWSGDMVGAQYYLPKGVSTDVLGYWYPDDLKGMIGNDQIAIPSTAQSPRLAHEFLNFLISDKYAFQNFTWVGYQPPLNSLNPDSLVKDGWVPKQLGTAIVRAENFDVGYFLLELSPEDDQIWQDAWDEFKAGG